MPEAEVLCYAFYMKYLRPYLRIIALIGASVLLVWAFFLIERFRNLITQDTLADVGGSTSSGDGSTSSGDGSSSGGGDSSGDST